MQVNIKICDRCKKETREDKNREDHKRGFEKITLMFGGCDNISYNYKINEREYLLCEECLKKIGIVRIEKKESEKNTQSIQDRLYDIIADIVGDITNN